MRASILFTLLAAGAFAQTPPEQDVDRLLTIAGTHSSQELQEIATSIRTIAKASVTINNEQTTLLLRAPSSSIALGEWLFRDLDQTASVPSTDEYKVPGSSDDV